MFFFFFFWVVFGEKHNRYREFRQRYDALYSSQFQKHFTEKTSSANKDENGIIVTLAFADNSRKLIFEVRSFEVFQDGSEYLFVFYLLFINYFALICILHIFCMRCFNCRNSEVILTRK